MLKMQIEFDDVKANADGVKVDVLYEYINKRFQKRNLEVLADGIYTGNDKERDLMQFMIMASALPEKDWFVKYISNWMWYEDSVEPENLIKTFELDKR